jgi:hypothetical protein
LIEGNASPRIERRNYETTEQNERMRMRKEEKEGDSSEDPAGHKAPEERAVSEARR